MQLLDLSMNKPAKELLRRKFQEWFNCCSTWWWHSAGEYPASGHETQHHEATRCTLAGRTLRLPMFQPILHYKWFLCSWHLGYSYRLTLIPFIQHAIHSVINVNILLYMYVKKKYRWCELFGSQQVTSDHCFSKYHCRWISFKCQVGSHCYGKYSTISASVLLSCPIGHHNLYLFSIVKQCLEIRKGNWSIGNHDRSMQSVSMQN